MSSYAKPKVLGFKATAAIAEGKAVTLDSTGKLVTASNAKTDLSVGIAQNAATAVNDYVEVALPGGGAKALAGGSIAAGDLLAPTTGGALITTVTAGDRWIAVAMEAASSGDLFSVHVSAGLI